MDSGESMITLRSLAKNGMYDKKETKSMKPERRKKTTNFKRATKPVMHVIKELKFKLTLHRKDLQCAIYLMVAIMFPTLTILIFFDIIQDPFRFIDVYFVSLALGCRGNHK